MSKYQLTTKELSQLSSPIAKELADKLLKYAVEARESSYSPYSKFRVGAALVAQNGAVYLGCNVENASYGGAICAERTAVVKAVSERQRDFLLVAVVTDQLKQISPCGFCRQFMVEFGKKTIVLMFSADGSWKEKRLDELLPDSFGPSDL